MIAYHPPPCVSHRRDTRSTPMRQNERTMIMPEPTKGITYHGKYDTPKVFATVESPSCFSGVVRLYDQIPCRHYVVPASSCDVWTAAWEFPSIDYQAVDETWRRLAWAGLKQDSMQIRRYFDAAIGALQRDEFGRWTKTRRPEAR